jgi:hypothetical protein
VHLNLQSPQDVGENLLTEDELVVGMCLGMGYHIKYMKLLIMDWRAGQIMSLSVCFCDVALNALLLFTCKEWFHFCCAIDKAFITSFEKEAFITFLMGHEMIC